MLNIPKKVADRFAQRIKPLQGLAASCKDRDINESDTVTLVMDILCDLLGYDKYSDLTKEHQIRNTYCDLAIKLDGKVRCLIECKAIGITLKDAHIQQALNYAANQGCEWVLLTNAATWKIFRVIFGQPISQELVREFDLAALSPKCQADMEILFALSREGLDRNALGDYMAGLQAKDRFCVAALLMTEPVVKLVRKELRAMNNGTSVELDEILDVIRDQVIKRELVDSEKAAEAGRRIKKFFTRRDAQKARAAVSAEKSQPSTDDDEQESEEAFAIDCGDDVNNG